MKPMEVFLREEVDEALKAIDSMIERSENAQAKFKKGTSQHTLQQNRIRALYIASALISREAGRNDAMAKYSEEELEKAVAPIESLISKSAKAQQKLAQDSWQYAMLENNLKALRMASPLLAKALLPE